MGQLDPQMIREIDNCPRGNTTVELETGFQEGAGEGDLFEEETEVMYGICKICGTKFRRRDCKGFMIYEEWVSPKIELDLKFLKLHLPFGRRWRKIKQKVIPYSPGF
jgi:hypothetical protein